MKVLSNTRGIVAGWHAVAKGQFVKATWLDVKALGGALGELDRCIRIVDGLAKRED